jgi:putative endonuclease
VRKRGGYVYIATNKSRTLYIGLTNDLQRRMSEHKHRIGSKFAIKYNITRLVYYEAFDDIRDAIAREKQLKRWRREKKVWLIERENPDWKDLSAGWYDDAVIPSACPERSRGKPKERLP